MSSQAEQPSLVLTRRLANGTIEWIPLEIPARVPAAPEAAYALIDRADYEAPQTMVVQRQGADLVVEVQGNEALVLDGFFATADAAFYPTPDIAGGAGPFSGSPLTADSPLPAGSLAGEQVVWSTGQGDRDDVADDGDGDGDGGELGSGGGTPLLWGGLAAGGLGLIALAGGGGGGSNGGGSTGGGGSSSDTVVPEITSGATATGIDENSGAGQVVYTAAATDASTVTYSLKLVDDAAAFSINASTGAVTLIADPDYETESSYNFTVVATDAANNSSEQTVSLTIEDQDDSAPFITSGATATPIDENSGASQVIYTATATDEEAVTYSLEAGDDAAAFSINANTGAVTLTGNPDFETQSSYSFTVVATDADGNSSQQAVSLAINNLDEVAPTVSNVALTSAIGAQNALLNAGDTVTVTVTMSENVDVDTSGGTPRIALNIGGSTVFAGYASGSGTASLFFDYTVRPGDTDTNGIRIPADALESNGGSIIDASGNTADLNHRAVADVDSYIVDTTAPTLSSSKPADEATKVAVNDDIVLTFSEDVQAGTGNIAISDGTDTRIIDVADGSQVRINGNKVTINPASDLDASSTYNVQIDNGALTDPAGNAYAGIGDTTTLNFDTEGATSADTSIVVFDLVQGSSSDHSSRTFQSGVSYDIYIRVESDDASLSTKGRGPGTWDTWEGAANLGSDDRIILVGDGAAVQGPFGPVTRVSVDETAVAWSTQFRFNAAEMQQNGSFTRATGFRRRDVDNTRLLDSSLSEDFLEDQGGQTNTMYLTNMPAGILTSQGLV